MQKLVIPITSTKAFGVSLGNGEAVQGAGECKGVRVLIQGLTVVEDFLPLELGNSEIILGIQWLEKLGTVMTNWKTQTLKFQVGSETVVIQGNPALGRSFISLKAMIRTLRMEGGGYLIECNLLVCLFPFLSIIVYVYKER